MVRTARVVIREAASCVGALLPLGRGLTVVTAVTALVVGTPIAYAVSDGSTDASTQVDTAAPPPLDTTAEPQVSFVFSGMADDGRPVRFEPCEPLSVVYEATGEPYPAIADVGTAVALLSDAMHRPLGFQSGGTVDGPSIAVVWVPTAGELPGHPRPETVGTGGYSSMRGTAVDGRVTLAASSTLSPGFGTGSWGAALLHELGHAVGLDHVPDRSEQMYPTVLDDRPAGFGAGDNAGLLQLGGPCPDSP